MRPGTHHAGMGPAGDRRGLVRHRSPSTLVLDTLTQSLLLLTVACSAPARGVPAPDGQAARAEHGRPGAAATGLPRDRPLDVFDRVCDLVEREFYDPDLGGVDWATLAAARRPLAAGAADEQALRDVLAPLLAELHTSHTRFVTSAEPAFHDLAAIFGLGPEFPSLFPDGVVTRESIGILGEPFEDGYLVLGVLHGSPAEAAGLLAGDVILAADGAPFAPVASFCGKGGQSVELSVRRRVDEPTRRFAVVPERVAPTDALLAAAEASMQVVTLGDRRVAYARVWSYADLRVHEALTAALTTGALSGADALVLDLRGGWGGANPAYLDLFNASVPQLEMVDRAGRVNVFDGRWRRPVVLLVDGGTRSGKEVLAHAFRRHGLGPVVGVRTAGAVTGGRAYPVGDRSLLYLAVMDARVDGERLEGVGVEPDVRVPFTQAYAAGADPQRARALALAAELAGAPR